MFNLGAIWDRPTIDYQANIFHKLCFQDRLVFYFVGAYFHSIKLFALILDTLLLANVSYSPLLFNQWKTVVPPDQAYFLLTISLLRQVLTFPARSADIVTLPTRGVSYINFFLLTMIYGLLNFD